MSVEPASAPWRVDVHAHILSPSYLAEVTPSMPRMYGQLWPDWSAPTALERMDRWGIAAQVVSLTEPGLRPVDPDRRGAVARRCNEEMAELVAAYPARFGALAALPLPDVAGSVAEVAYALDHLGLDGVAVLSSEGGLYIGDPVMEDLMAALDRRSAWVMIHPGRIQELAEGVLPPMAIEFPFDVTRAAVNLIVRGVPRRYPNIRWFLAQAGGTLPFLASRIAAFMAMPGPMKSDTGMPDSALAMTPADVLDAVSHFYFDTTLATGRSAMRSVLEVTTRDHVLYGSDLPFGRYAMGGGRGGSDPSPELSETFSATERRGVDRHHALAHFPRLAAAIGVEPDLKP
jgi:predicted TIM-barrel fold metal-dependent hydrolase